MNSPATTRVAGLRIPWGRIAAWFVATRLLILLIAQLALLGVAKGPHFTGNPNVLEAFIRWDAGWYMGIARDGYTYNPAAQCSVVFLPLYPLLLKVVWYAVGNYAVAGALVANAALLGLCGLLWRFARELLGSESAAHDAVLLLLLSPVTFFFSSIYSESLFLFAMLATMWSAHRRNWIGVAVAGYLAGLTRSVGFLLVIPLAVEWIQQGNLGGTEPAGRRWGRLAACLMPGAGLATYFAYLGVKFGDPLAYVHVQNYWFQKFTWPTETFHNTYANLAPFYGWWFTLALVAGVIALGLGWRRLPAAQRTLAVTFTVFYLCKNHLDSLPRYLSIVYPFYLAQAAALQRWPWTGKWIWSLNAVFLTLSTILFVTGFYFS
ncbi:MAG TPA: mannosyltransferase family protein [Opitutaceae bacterium]|nr:mannosyltransferase family protein [Opitutaceae bacterium]HND62551.1 mannosyltransferase family protein [Opitutaceae bacterium]